MHLPSDGEVQLSKFDLHAADYHLVAADLRNLTEVQKKLEESHFNKCVSGGARRVGIVSFLTFTAGRSNLSVLFHLVIDRVETVG